MKYLIALLFSLNAAAAECPALPPAHVLEANSHLIAESWDFAPGPALWTEAPAAAAGSATGRMLEWARGFAPDADQRALLQRQRAIYVSAGLPQEVAVFDRILNVKDGAIQPAACLDSLLLEQHLARMPSFEGMREFQAIIFEHPGTGQIRAYFVSSDAEGQSITTPGWLAAIREDARAGWKARAHLHFHPFHLPSTVGEDIAGTVIPSSQDVRTYLDYAQEIGLREARVTNGISTFVLPAAQFRDLAR